MKAKGEKYKLYIGGIYVADVEQLYEHLSIKPKESSLRNFIAELYLKYVRRVMI